MGVEGDKLQTGQLKLVRDVLDAPLLDRKGREMGRADGLVIELRDGQAPRVVAVERGLGVALARVHPRLGRWVEALGRRFGLRGEQAISIPWEKVKAVGLEVVLSLDAAETAALAWEKWLREHVIGRVPLSGGLKDGGEE